MSTDVLIYCNGDSFVNGHELGDDLITGYPGYHDYSDTGTIRKKSNIWYSKSFDESTDSCKERNYKTKDIFRKQHELAFPNLIQKHTGLKVINAATTYLGNSQGCITRNTITDLYNLKQQYSKIITIIGVTSINRLDLPNKRGGWHNIMLSGNSVNSKDHYETQVNGLMDFYYHYYKSYHLYIDWLKNVLLIKNFCEVNNIDLLWTTGIHPLVCDDLPDEPDLLAFFNSVKLVYDVNLVELAQTINKQTMCPGYHFSPIVHEKAAELFVEKIYKLI